MPDAPPRASRKKKWRELVIGGGGMNGIMMLGAAQCLYDRGLLGSVRRFVGTSVGAVLCTLLVLGYRSDVIMGVLRGVPFQSFDEVDGNSLLAFFDTFGMMTARRVMDVVQAFLRVRGVRPGVTFDELGALTRCDLVITGYNVSRGRTEAFSRDTHAGMPVMKALEISCGVPFIFRPILHDGDLYVDGGLVDIIPSAFVRSRRRAVVLKMEIAKRADHVMPSDVFDYTLLLTSRLYATLDRHGSRAHRKMHVVPLLARGAWDMMNFRMDNAGKEALYALGYEQAQTHLEAARCAVETQHL